MAVSIASPLRMTMSNDTIPLAGNYTRSIGARGWCRTVPRLSSTLRKWGCNEASSSGGKLASRRFPLTIVCTNGVVPSRNRWRRDGRYRRLPAEAHRLSQTRTLRTKYWMSM
jgi:hypothetical protein